MDEYIPGKVYDNLIKLLTYRNVKLVGDELTSEVVAQKLNHFEYVTINGARAADDIRGAAFVIIILIAPNSKYANKSMDFKKLVKTLPKVAENEKLEVMFVSNNALTLHIKKYMNQYNLDNANIMLESFDYSPFIIEIPKHVSVPLHTIPPEEEVESFCNDYYTSRVKFPKIMVTDPAAIWLGLRPGMVTRIERPSETAGYAIVYRYCI